MFDIFNGLFSLSKLRFDVAVERTTASHKKFVTTTFIKRHIFLITKSVFVFSIFFKFSYFY